jgi:hypothetical protein
MYYCQEAMRNLLLLTALGIVLFFITVKYVPSLGFVFIIPAFILAGFFFNRHADKNQTEQLAQSIKYTQEELDAQVWLEQDAVPHVSKTLTKNRAWIIGIGSLSIVLFLLVWMSYFFTLYLALTGVCLFLFLGAYVLFAVWGYKKLESRYPACDNDWLRGYFYMVIPLAFLAGVYFHHARWSQLFIYIPYYLFLGTVAYASFYTATTLYVQMKNEKKQKLEKAVKKALTDEKDG